MVYINHNSPRLLPSHRPMQFRELNSKGDLRKPDFVIIIDKVQSFILLKSNCGLCSGSALQVRHRLCTLQIHRLYIKRYTRGNLAIASESQSGLQGRVCFDEGVHVEVCTDLLLQET